MYTVSETHTFEDGQVEFIPWVTAFNQAETARIHIGMAIREDSESLECDEKHAWDDKNLICACTWANGDVTVYEITKVEVR